jgi:hypothetical protein
MRVKLLCTLAMTVLVGCDDQSAKALDWAKSQADKAEQQAAQAQQDLKHIQRLRDTDRMQFDTEIKNATAEATAWRGLLVGLSILLAIVLIWLAREVRSRRVLSRVLLARKSGKEVKLE